jgi:hypothetical protein
MAAPGHSPGKQKRPLKHTRKEVPAMTATPAGQGAHAGPMHDDGARNRLAGYLEAMEADDAPLLGHLVLYSVFGSRVTADDMRRWFQELGLDQAFAPPRIRAVDAFEKVTGPAGVRMTYPLGSEPARRRRRQDGRSRAATLMIRPVRRDAHRIVRHLVREVRDEAATRLSYDVRLAECVFLRDSNLPPRPARVRCRSLRTPPRSGTCRPPSRGRSAYSWPTSRAPTSSTAPT